MDSSDPRAAKQKSKDGFVVTGSIPTGFVPSTVPSGAVKKKSDFKSVEQTDRRFGFRPSPWGYGHDSERLMDGLHRCTATGERADFWLLPKPGMTDRQKGGLFLFSLLRGLSSAMKGGPRAGVSCDIHPTSLIALIGEAKGVRIGPVVYAHNSCRPHAPSCQATQVGAACE